MNVNIKLEFVWKRQKITVSPSFHETQGRSTRIFFSLKNFVDSEIVIIAKISKQF